MNHVLTVPQRQESSSLAMAFERVLTDPTIPIERLREMLAIQVDIETRAERRAYNQAMAAAQASLARVSADASNPQTKSKYATLGALDRAVRPVYSEHGFALEFDTADGAPEGHIRVVCDVSHGAGYTKRFHIDMPADGKGAKGGDVMTKTHATGSAVSYGRRYLILMIFNLAVGDDDGNAAGGSTISAEQEQALAVAVAAAEADIDRFLGVFKVESLGDLPAKDYIRAMGMLAAKQAANKPKPAERA